MLLEESPCSLSLKSTGNDCARGINNPRYVLHNGFEMTCQMVKLDIKVPKRRVLLETIEVERGKPRK